LFIFFCDIIKIDTRGIFAMLTQQDLINRLNQLTLRYNLTWFDIKYDADKAINKINGFMGTKYPKLSDYLVGPTDTYNIPFSEPVLDADGNLQYDAQGKLITEPRDREVIKEEYFHSVIIPYIASEILARDEEFTTIYTKYVNEMQEGLYDMFQREFNNVPFEFRQNPGEGVFFGEDTALGITQHNARSLNVPTFKFKVLYYPNDNSIDLASRIDLQDSTFIEDPKVYIYDQVATILYPAKNPNTNDYYYYYSVDGATAYKFDSWSKNFATVGTVFTESPTTPTTVKMRSDLKLYAIWDKSEVLVVDNVGVLSINPVHRPALINLVIPEYVNGIAVRNISSNFSSANITEGTDHLKTIYLPSTILELSANAFNNFRGERIVLNEGLTTIRANAFANTLNLNEIIIPASVTHIEEGAFPVVSSKQLTIKVRRLQINVPGYQAGPPATGWHPEWYKQGSNYTVIIVWGYNGA
jgi:hypothetical protein